MKNITRYSVTILAALISGIVTSRWFDSTFDITGPTVYGFYLTGLYFGIALIILARIFKTSKSRLSFVRSVLFLVASCIAFQAAYLVGLFGDGGDDMSGGISFFVAGVVGAILLGIGYSYLVHPISKKSIVHVAIVGGLLGILFLHWGDCVSVHNVPFFLRNFLFLDEPLAYCQSAGLLLFPIWQIGVALAFGKATNKINTPGLSA